MAIAGVEVYPGFAASELLLSERQEILGVATADVGIDKNGVRKDTFARGIELRAKQTLLAEVCCCARRVPSCQRWWRSQPW